MELGAMNDRDREYLEFESLWWYQRGNKETEIVRRFEVSAIRYYRRLNLIIDDPEALESYPQLVNRLRRIRSERVTARTQRRDLT
jgi:hypothetical protein